MIHQFRNMGYLQCLDLTNMQDHSKFHKYNHTFLYLHPTVDMPKTSKGIYGKYSEDALEKAIAAVRGGLSYAKAAKKHCVPRSTICDRVSGRIQPGSVAGRKPALPPQVEDELVSRAISAADKGFGISRKQLMIKAGQVAKKMKLDTPFKDNIAGKDWFLGLKERHPELSIRKPQRLSTARSKSMNRQTVSQYFGILGDLQSQLPTEERPQVIWNMDETGLSMEHSPQSVIARRGVNTVPGRVSCSRENVTVIACINAAGTTMPPMIIVKGKTHRSLWAYNTQDGPAGAIWTWQQKAWTEDALGVMWFQKVFLPNCGPARPQLLVLDQHRSHEVTEMLELAELNHIAILGMPPHTSHWLQPLDKGCFGPLSQHYNRACSLFMSEATNRVVCKATWAQLFSQAWDSAMTAHNAIQGFRVTAIYPLNPAAIPERAFAPASCYTQASTESVDSAPAVTPSPSQTDAAAAELAPSLSLRSPVSCAVETPGLAETAAVGLAPSLSLRSPVSCAVETPSLTQAAAAELVSALSVCPPTGCSIETPGLVLDMDASMTADDVFRLVEYVIDIVPPSPDTVVDLPIFVDPITDQIVSVIETGQLIKAPEKQDISTEALTVSDAIAEVFKPVAAPSNARNALQKKRKQPLCGARVLTSPEILEAKRKLQLRRLKRKF